MAPSSGHLLVPKVLKIAKFAVTQAGALIRSKIPQISTGTANAVLQPIRIHPHTQAIHPQAFLRQIRSRKFSAQAHVQSQRVSRPSFQDSRIGQAVTKTVGSPFASTLRPNLTGGTLSRSAGGYGLGGTVRGVRQFSHTGGTQAQVIQNVNAGIRAFCVGGGKARFDGIDGKTGEKRFKAVSHIEDTILRKLDTPNPVWAKGTNLEFRLNPTITALSTSFPCSEAHTLGTYGLLDSLSIDFARAFKDLSIILTDIQRLAQFGDLPISLSAFQTGGCVLKVRFAGCDADTVSRLCDEVGIRRGAINEDEEWTHDKAAEMALLFPFAPGKTVTNNDSESAYLAQTIQVDREVAPEQLEWQNMMSPQRYAGPTSEPMIPNSERAEEVAIPEGEVWSASGYESLGESDFADDDPYYYNSNSLASRPYRSQESFEGLEGIYKFLAECDDARR